MDVSEYTITRIELKQNEVTAISEVLKCGIREYPKQFENFNADPDDHPMIEISKRLLSQLR